MAEEAIKREQTNAEAKVTLDTIPVSAPLPQGIRHMTLLVLASKLQIAHEHVPLCKSFGLQRKNKSGLLIATCA